MDSRYAAPAIVRRGSDEFRVNTVLQQNTPRSKVLLLGEATMIGKVLPQGIALPTHPNTVTHTCLGPCLWLRPSQWLFVIVATAQASAAALELRGLQTPDAWTVDAGARYVEFSVSGPGATAVLNSGCSLDMREEAFRVDRCAQTRFDRTPILLLRAAADRFEIFAERPLSAHLWLSLCRALEDL
jgi:heterotetrameric sarcosine oxidase gamma subunit